MKKSTKYTDWGELHIQSNYSKQRKRAFERYNRVLRRYKLFKSIPIQNTPSLVNEHHILLGIARRDLKDAIKDARQHLHRMHCNWSSYSTLEKSNQIRRIAYTIDKDGNGYYWARIIISKRLKDAPIPIAAELGRKEFKFRKRKKAKEKAVKLWYEHNVKVSTR